MLRSLLITGATLLAVSGVKRLARFVITQVVNRDLNNIQLPRRGTPSDWSTEYGTNFHNVALSRSKAANDSGRIDPVLNERVVRV
ncbi:hypothetical protein BSKO_06901 [Bryopsis sp. KO-2023]|nr:hypothetical protein BSKO_06901 [Bryopsis sp. KO-2023]